MFKNKNLIYIKKYAHNYDIELNSPIEPTNDTFLVKELIKHNELAFQQLYIKYHVQIYSFTLGLVKSKVIAEGILQEVFIQIWVNCASLNPDLSFKSFLFTIARNKSINFLKKASNNRLLREEIFRNTQYKQNYVEDYLDNADYTIIHTKAIESLPPKRKLIFEMSRSKEMSYEDISKELGISINTVKSQMSKALTTIRDYIKLNTDITLLLLLIIESRF